MRGGSPARRLASAPGGRVQDAFYASPWLLGFLKDVSGVPLVPTLESEGEPIGVRRGRWKYILGGALREELYDLAADAAERHNLAAVERRQAAELRRATRRFVEEVPFTVLEAETLSPEMRKQLEALGYL